MKPRKKILGFTLVELMITIAVISILAAIAYPIYQDYVYKSRRAAARGSLLELAQFMERNYTEANRYDKFSGGNVAVVLPFDTSPKVEDKTQDVYYYDLEPANLAENRYELRAVPQPRQSGDRCGTLTLLWDGTRDAAESDCW